LFAHHSSTSTTHHLHLLLFLFTHYYPTPYNPLKSTLETLKMPIKGMTDLLKAHAKFKKVERNMQVSRDLATGKFKKVRAFIKPA
jgi:hypothetical protein